MPKKLLAQKIFFFYSYLRNDILTIVHKCQSTLNAFIAHLFINVSIYTTYCCDGCGSGNGAASSLLTYSIHASHIKLCVCVCVFILYVTIIINTHAYTFFCQCFEAFIYTHIFETWKLIYLLLVYFFVCSLHEIINKIIGLQFNSWH